MGTNVIQVRELNQNTSAVLARVQAGEELVISVSGTPVARLSPLSPSERTLVQLVATGRMIPAVDSTPFVRPPLTGVVHDTTAVLMDERYGEDAR
jgi:prevent-host-death family protein